HDGSVLIGGCRDADPGPERSGRAALNPRIQAALAAFLPEAFPDAGPVAVARRWAGIMDATPDGRPLLGAWPGDGGMWIAAGLGGGMYDAGNAVVGFGAGAEDGMDPHPPNALHPACELEVVPADFDRALLRLCDGLGRRWSDVAGSVVTDARGRFLSFHDPAGS